jgi:hypothetical protein
MYSIRDQANYPRLVFPVMPVSITRLNIETPKKQQLKLTSKDFNRGKANIARQAASKHRKFNMSTYKLHALGDYVKSTWLYGSTDSYSNQVVSSRLFTSHAEKSD